MKLCIKKIVSIALVLLVAFNMLAGSIITVNACTFEAGTSRTFTDARVFGDYRLATIPGSVAHQASRNGLWHYGMIPFNNTHYTGMWRNVGVGNYNRTRVAVFIGMVSNTICPG